MKIAIAGYGLEGEQNYAYWAAADNEVTILDEKETPDRPLPEKAEHILGPGVYGELGEYDMVIRTAGLPPRKLTSAKKIWSATNEFFEKCPAPIIGVTGTKGKGTTSSFIASILTAAGKKVHLVGNIGKPALAVLSKIEADDIVVYELSSFQLWDVKKSPHIAVVLMIEPDHLDVHDNMEDYVNAKSNITRFQSENDTVVYNALNELSRSIAEHSSAQKIEYPFDLGDLATTIKLPGAHNLDNASAAVAATKEYVSDDESIAHGLSAFVGLPHRLQFVAEKEGVKYYDDSIATTPGSAIAALASFEEPKVIILGGHDKGADYTELIESCERTSSTVIAVGSNGGTIEELCRDANVACVREEGDMQAIVARAHETAGEGSVVILSPAAASFDMFKSYADRGNQFAAAVENL